MKSAHRCAVSWMRWPRSSLIVVDSPPSFVLSPAARHQRHAGVVHGVGLNDEEVASSIHGQGAAA